MKKEVSEKLLGVLRLEIERLSATLDLAESLARDEALKSYVNINSLNANQVASIEKQTISNLGWRWAKGPAPGKEPKYRSGVTTVLRTLVAGLQNTLDSIEVLDPD